MSGRLTRIWLLPILLFAGQALALGLGDIRLSSALNEPLRAEIDLLAAAPEELNNLKVELASAETFDRYGLDRPLFLGELTFDVIESGSSSGNVIRVRSSRPVSEPFVTFLVEASWSRGRLLREYTLLLDPPTFAPPPVAQSSPAVTAPSRTTQTDTGRIQRQAPPPVAAPSDSRPRTQAPPAAASPADPAPQTFDREAGGDIRVQRGDTLWGIALQVRPDSRLTMNQTMMALYETNPQAFANNINKLKAGSILRVPSADNIYRISRGDALNSVRQQNEDWRSGRVSDASSDPTLKLLPPDEDQRGYDDSPGTSDLDYSRNADIQDRIAELEAQVANQESLIEIRDNELAQLRAELARMRGEQAIEPVPDEPVADDTMAPADDAQAGDDEIVAGPDDEAGAIDADELDIAPPVVVQPTPAPSLVDTVMGYVMSIWGAIAAAVLLLLGGLVWFGRRAGRSDEDLTGVWEPLDADELVEQGEEDEQASTQRLRALAQDDASSIVVVEQDSTGELRSVPEAQDTVDAPLDFPVDVDEDEDTAANKSIEDTFSSDTAINLDQSDPLAEADFHMAYGLHDQAADLLNGALQVEPAREDLLAKLCEVYFVWGNRDGFVDAAQKLRDALGSESGAEWGKIIIMGQQIAAEHELFSGKTAADATKAVDLSFDGGPDEPALDMDFAGGPDGGVSDVIDLGAASGNQPDLADVSSIDFSFEDLDSSTSTTREMPGKDLADVDFNEAETDFIADDDDLGGGTAEMPTIEQEFDRFEPTEEVPVISEAANDIDDDGLPADGIPSADQTAEINLDDLGLDLDSLAETSFASDFESDDATVETDIDATGEIAAIDFDEMEETGRNLGLDEDESAAATGRHPALDDTLEAEATAMSEDSDAEDILVATSEMAILDETVEADAAGLPEDPDAEDALDATSEIALDETVEADLAKIVADQDAEDSQEATSEMALLDETVEVAPDAEDALAATSEIGALPDDDATIDSSLLDATGQTQVLSDDFAIKTGTEADSLISDDDKTMLAAPRADDQVDVSLPEDAETLLAPLDDDGDAQFTETAALTVGEDSEFDFAKTEALPKEAFEEGTAGVDAGATGELPRLTDSADLTGSTDMDLDLDDLTAALKITDIGDTVDQPRDEATMEQPGIASDEYLDAGAEDDAPTMQFSADEVPDDLHDARTMTEVGTKLDLARAYVDMGDPSGAKSILEEVLQEGDEAQRQQAQQLLDSLPS